MPELPECRFWRAGPLHLPVITAFVFTDRSPYFRHESSARVPGPAQLDVQGGEGHDGVSRTG